MMVGANVSNSKASSSWEVSAGSFIVISLAVHHILFAHIRSFIRLSDQYSSEHLKFVQKSTLLSKISLLCFWTQLPLTFGTQGPICLKPFALYLPSKIPTKEKATAVRFFNPFALLITKFRKKPEGRKTALAGTTIFTSQVRTGVRDLLQTICNSPLKIFTHS